MSNTATDSVYCMGKEQFTDISAKDVFLRMCEATDTVDCEALALWLDVTKEEVGQCLQENNVPVAWLLAMLARKSDYSMEWVLTGKGPKLLAHYHLK